MDVANYPKQQTLTISGCGEDMLESVLESFADACRQIFEQEQQQVQIYREDFKTANAGRKIGGLIGFAAKLAQKTEPGFVVDGGEDMYKIFLVAGQYRDEVMFDIYCYTGFNALRHGHGKTQREFEYKSRKYEQARDNVEKAFGMITE